MRKHCINLYTKYFNLGINIDIKKITEKLKYLGLECKKIFYEVTHALFFRKRCTRDCLERCCTDITCYTNWSVATLDLLAYGKTE